MNTGTENINQEQHLQYDAKLGEIYKIWILNVILNILTLGIYSFWGKTRMRRYLLSSFSLLQDRFEYTGFGKELFFGFIKAILFLILLTIPFIVADVYLQSEMQKIQSTANQAQTDNNFNNLPYSAPNRQNMQYGQNKKVGFKEDFKKSYDEGYEKGYAKGYKFGEALGKKIREEGAIGLLLAFVVELLYFLFLIFYLPPLAKYSALHYRASRVKWRGIRGHLYGNAFKYAWIYLCYSLALIIFIFLLFCLSFLLPTISEKRELLFNEAFSHISFTKEFLSAHLLEYAFVGYALLALIVIFVIIPLVIVGKDTRLTKYKMSNLCFGNQIFNFDGKIKKLYFRCLICLILFIPTLGISWLWYKSALAHYRFNNLSLQTIRFKTILTGWRLFTYHLQNSLIIIITLGLGRPIILSRKMKFFADNVFILGDIEKSNIFQNQGNLPTTGEGLVTFFDLDLGFF